MCRHDWSGKGADPAMMQIRYKYELNQQLNRVNGLLLLNIWAHWSLQCRSMYNVVRKITPRLDVGDAVAFIDWHHHRELANSLDVYGVPTLIIFAGGREVDRFSGVTGEAVLQRYVDDEKKAMLASNERPFALPGLRQIDSVNLDNR